MDNEEQLRNSIEALLMQFQFMISPTVTGNLYGKGSAWRGPSPCAGTGTIMKRQSPLDGTIKASKVNGCYKFWYYALDTFLPLCPFAVLEESFAGFAPRLHGAQIRPGASL